MQIHSKFMFVQIAWNFMYADHILRGRKNICGDLMFPLFPADLSASTGSIAEWIQWNQLLLVITTTHEKQFSLIHRTLN